MAATARGPTVAAGSIRLPSCPFRARRREAGYEPEMLVAAAEQVSRDTSRSVSNADLSGPRPLTPDRSGADGRGSRSARASGSPSHDRR